MILEAAMAWYDAGTCVIPPREDGKKGPAWDWKKYQAGRASREQTERWFKDIPRQGVGLLCGQVSGNLEMMELEGCATSSADIDAIIAECSVRGIDWLWDLLTQDGYAEWTPSGGLHFLYRVDGNPVPGNHKVAQRPRTAEELQENPQNKGAITLAETRGEGGYVIVAPSGGTVHPTGQSWDVAAGAWGKVPTVAEADRDLLQEAIHAALDRMPSIPKYEPPARPVLSGSGTRPGDDFAARTDWADILEPEGFRVTKQSGLYREWERPGKNQGSCSITTGKTPEDRLYCFSSNTPFFEPGEVYNKFAAYVLINYGFLGSETIRQATKDLSAKGFGTPLERSSTPPGNRLLLDSAETVETPASLAVHVPSVPNTTAVPAATPVDIHGRPVFRDEMFSTVSWTQSGMGEMWRQVHENRFAYNSGQKEWMGYEAGCWKPEEHQSAKETMDNMVNRLYAYASRQEAADPENSKGMRSEVKKLMSNQAISGALSLASCKRGISVSVNDFDKDKNLVALQNGTFSLATGELRPHSPHDMLTRKVNAPFDGEKKEGRWTEFMEQVLPNPEVRQYLQRVCGYMLTGTLNERIMVLIHGESGTGKTQFLEALRGVLGDFAGVAPASAFQPRTAGYKGPSEDLHKLMGKRLVIQSELDAGSRLNESLVKSIVGADTQTSRPLYGAPIDWIPEYTVFMATNYLPRISSSDNAIWNRVKPVKFEQVFINSSGQALDPADRNLGRRMAQEEPEVILNWLLEGLADYEKFGLNEPAQVKAWLSDYREEVDTTRQFLTEAPEEGRIVVGEGRQATSRELYNAYAAWCRDNSIMPLGSKTFTERMVSNGREKRRTEKGTVWPGIGLGGWIGEAQTAVGYPRRT